MLLAAERWLSNFFFLTNALPLLPVILGYVNLLI